MRIAKHAGSTPTVQGILYRTRIRADADTGQTLLAVIAFTTRDLERSYYSVSLLQFAGCSCLGAHCMDRTTELVTENVALLHLWKRAVD